MTAPFCDVYIDGYSGHKGGPNGTITRIVIHGTVSPCQDGAARNTATYFQSPNSGGLAHYVVDPSATVGCCDLNEWCWHAPPNPGSIGIELTDPVAGSASRWNDAEHKSMLHRAAALVAKLCDKFNLPVVKLSPSDLVVGKHGICGHVDVSQAWHQSDHSDPGTDFPWATFIQMVKDSTHANPFYPHRLVRLHGEPGGDPVFVIGKDGAGLNRMHIPNADAVKRWQNFLHNDGQDSSIITIQQAQKPTLGAIHQVDYSEPK